MFGKLSCKIRNRFSDNFANDFRFSLRQWKLQERRWYICNHIYAWSVPCIMTTIVAVRNFSKPILGVSTCWFHRKRQKSMPNQFKTNNHLLSDDSDQWSLVYLPISVMLALNVFLCLWSSLSLVRNDFSPDARKALRYK